jgi:hypothetical protein
VTYTLHTGDESTVGDASATDIPTANGRTVGLAQIELTGSLTGSFQIQGRLGSAYSWVNLLTSAATGNSVHSVALFPQMRATASGLGGTGAFFVGLLTEPG